MLWRPINSVKAPKAMNNMYKTRHVLANILHSHYVARMPPVEARSPGRRSNVGNALRRRPVTGQQHAQTPTSVHTMSSYRGMDASL